MNTEKTKGEMFAEILKKSFYELEDKEHVTTLDIVDVTDQVTDDETNTADDADDASTNKENATSVITTPGIINISTNISDSTNQIVDFTVNMAYSSPGILDSIAAITDSNTCTAESPKNIDTTGITNSTPDIAGPTTGNADSTNDIAKSATDIPDFTSGFAGSKTPNAEFAAKNCTATMEDATAGIVDSATDIVDSPHGIVNSNTDIATDTINATEDIANDITKLTGVTSTVTAITEATDATDSSVITIASKNVNTEIPNMVDAATDVMSHPKDMKTAMVNVTGDLVTVTKLPFKISEITEFHSEVLNLNETAYPDTAIKRPIDTAYSDISCAQYKTSSVQFNETTRDIVIGDNSILIEKASIKSSPGSSKEDYNTLVKKDTAEKKAVIDFEDNIGLSSAALINVSDNTNISKDETNNKYNIDPYAQTLLDSLLGREDILLEGERSATINSVVESKKMYTSENSRKEIDHDKLLRDSNERKSVQFDMGARTVKDIKEYPCERRGLIELIAPSEDCEDSGSSTESSLDSGLSIEELKLEDHETVTLTNSTAVRSEAANYENENIEELERSDDQEMINQNIMRFLGDMLSFEEAKDRFTELNPRQAWEKAQEPRYVPSPREMNLKSKSAYTGELQHQAYLIYVN